MQEQGLYLIALSMVKGLNEATAVHLLTTFGDAKAIFSEKHALLAKVPHLRDTVVTELNKKELLLRAEKEVTFIEKNGLLCYFWGDDNYPYRLKECPDAPIVLYFKGTADLNSKHIISIVGTRSITGYGKSLTESLVSDLAKMRPDTLIISGLAHGVDVCSHQEAMRQHLPTVGVLAHGLDRIYPAANRGVAVAMVQQGGLITDYPSMTRPDKQNFLKRNRIIAGLSDATIVIESAERGGSLVTADIAFSYGRDVYTFPGRITDAYSKGCNRLIKMNKAGLICSAKDLIEALRWEPKQSKQPKQQRINFHNETFEPLLQRFMEKEAWHVNELATAMDLPFHQLSALLFELELEGVLRVEPGNIYRLKG